MRSQRAKMAFREVAGNNIFGHIQCKNLTSAQYTQENDATALTRNAPLGKPWQAVVWEARGTVRNAGAVYGILSVRGQ